MTDIVWVNTFAPPIIEFLFQGVTDELKPLAVEPGAPLVKATDPDENRCAVRHRSETLFTCTHDLLGLLPVRDVTRKTGEHGRTFSRRPADAEFNRHLCPIGAKALHLNALAQHLPFSC